MGQYGISRRNFVKSSAAGVVSAAVARVTPEPAVQVNRNNRILLKGGMVLSLDRNIGDFALTPVQLETY